MIAKLKIKLSKLFQKFLIRKKQKLLRKVFLNLVYTYYRKWNPFLLEQIYNDKKDEIIQQLESEILVKRIKDNDFDISQIAFLKIEDLHPEKYKKILKKKQIVEIKRK